MALLQIYPNETQKNQDIQNQQTFIALQNIYRWSGEILTQTSVDYIQTDDTVNNLTTNSTVYSNIPNFTYNFSPKNALGLVTFSITLQGTGYIGLFVNGLLLREIPFLNGVFSQVNFNRAESFAIGNNKVSLAWRSTAGTLTLATTKGSPHFNTFQIISINS
jgi:hypothetical protein